MSDHTLPDPDSVEVRIGCERDGEADECPTCGGSGREHLRGWGPTQQRFVGEWSRPCPTCHGTGVK